MVILGHSMEEPQVYCDEVTMNMELSLHTASDKLITMNTTTKTQESV